MLKALRGWATAFSPGSGQSGKVSVVEGRSGAERFRSEGWRKRKKEEQLRRSLDTFM